MMTVPLLSFLLTTPMTITLLMSSIAKTNQLL